MPKVKPNNESVSPQEWIKSLFSEPAFTCLKLTMETLELGVKYVQRGVVLVSIVNCEHVSIVNFEQVNAAWVKVGFCMWLGSHRSYRFIKYFQVGVIRHAQSISNQRVGYISKVIPNY